jgi:hypothetical protein
MVSLDRIEVRLPDGKVLCPIRDARVNVAHCVVCRRLIQIDDAIPPRYVVCEGRIVTGWLGIDRE